ncbi:LppM family (lipo)protein [Nocardioides sp. AE5]|uniref:LppM family (lipo)protein n=1 Tax=Nocardioides sp. AE5 TaxID=2962573 RepID=UPI0028821E9D|nr:hypothetical protein [Nocardioides sp. AE5]MDT0203823.1 hypothetical protein [Nocardioides sp. AE5]
MALLLLVALGGCYRTEISFTVHEDETISGALILAIEKSALQQCVDFEGADRPLRDVWEEFSDPELADDEMMPPGAVIEPWEDETHLGERAVFEGVPVADFVAWMAEDSGGFSLEHTDGRWILEMEMEEELADEDIDDFEEFEGSIDEDWDEDWEADLTGAEIREWLTDPDPESRGTGIPELDELSAAEIETLSDEELLQLFEAGEDEWLEADLDADDIRSELQDPEFGPCSAMWMPGFTGMSLPEILALPDDELVERYTTALADEALEDPFERYEEEFADLTLRISVTFPGPVIESNGEVDGTTVTWEVDLDGPVTAEDGQLRAVAHDQPPAGERSGLRSALVPVAVAVGATSSAAALAWLIPVWRRRRSED